MRGGPHKLSWVRPGPLLDPRPRGGCSRARHSRRPFPRPLWCVGTTFSSLAPPDAAASEMFCSCLILSLKSDTHWMTVMPAGTV